MIHAQNEKRQVLVNQAMTTGGTVAAVIDCAGWSYCNIEVYPGVTTTNMSVLKVGEGDTSTAFTDISGCVGDTDFTIPAVFTAVTDAAGIASTISLGIDCRKRKRYLQLSATAAAAMASMVAVARLSRGEENPNTDAEAGCAEIVKV